MSNASAVNHKEKRINAISTKTNILLLCILTVFALLCVLPVILVVVVSFSSEQSIFQNGYSFFPTELSLNAYRFFLRLGDQIIRSYGITIFVTVVGTLFSLAVTTMLSYVLSRPDYRYGKILTFLLLFTMLFNGGLVPSYMVNTQLLGLRDSVWALIFPMSLNAFYVIVLRTFFKSIPLEIIEAAHIDGAGEFKTFLRVVLPLSKPGIATIGLFTVIAYWNDWFLGMLKVLDKGIIKQLKTQGPTYNQTPPLETMGGVFAYMGKLRWTRYGQGGIVLSMALPRALLDILSRG